MLDLTVDIDSGAAAGVACSVGGRAGVDPSIAPLCTQPQAALGGDDHTPARPGD